MDEDEHSTLARIDERVRSLQITIQRLEREFVSLARYIPVERLVFGLVIVVLSGVATAMLTLVLRR